MSFLENGDQLGWYVNFQEPYRRAECGIQMMDLALDIIVEPDRSSWRWKDMDEFEMFRRRGLFDEATAERVLLEAKQVIGRVEADAPPFNSDWPEWRPDPSWETPDLLEDWGQFSSEQ